MRLPTLFRQNRNKSYDYTPRYYNERKERIASLMKAKEAKPNKDYFEGYRKKSFRDDWKAKKSEEMDKNRKIRFVVIFIFLLIFTYALLRYDKLSFLF
ncbi:MAG: hypothetical protein V3U92_20135 [Cellulophaga sp.]